MTLDGKILWHRLPATLSAVRAAELLGVSRWTIGRLMDAGEIDALRLRANRRVRTASLKSWYYARISAGHLDDARLIGGPKNRRRVPCS